MSEQPGGPRATTTDGDADRVRELRERLAAVEARTAAACTAAGRLREGVAVVVVTKTFPAADVRRLAALGVSDVGEAREQEARAKRGELEDDAGPAADLRWHFLGRLQRNKAASVAAWADLVHSCDSERLAVALSGGAERAGRVLPVLVQVDLSARDDGEAGDASRGGVPPRDVTALADRVAGLPALRLDGLMAVAPRQQDPAAAFERLAASAQALRGEHPQARVVSAGMSGDLEQAVAAGATHLRVGRAVLGARPPLG